MSACIRSSALKRNLSPKQNTCLYWKSIKLMCVSSRLTAQDQLEIADSTAQELYRCMIGNLLYLASLSRPDISFAVSELSRFVSSSGKPHLERAKRVFRYLKKTITVGLVYRSSPSEMLPNMLWAGLGWMSRLSSSYFGLRFILNGAKISWRSEPLQRRHVVRWVELPLHRPTIASGHIAPRQPL